MKEAKYTPGPWHLIHASIEPPMFRVCTDDGTTIAEFRDAENARLFIAAPKLAAALEELETEVAKQGWINCTPKPSERQSRINLLNNARAALAKAGLL